MEMRGIIIDSYDKLPKDSKVNDCVKDRVKDRDKLVSSVSFAAGSAAPGAPRRCCEPHANRANFLSQRTNFSVSTPIVADSHMTKRPKKSRKPSCLMLAAVTSVGGRLDRSFIPNMRHA